MLRRTDKGSERFERALEGGPVPHDPSTRNALAAAGALAPGHRRSSTRIQQTHDAMLAAFDRAQSPAESRDNAGSADGLDEIELHREEVELPGGGKLIVSDLEPLTPERMAETTRLIAEMLESKSKDRQP